MSAECPFCNFNDREVVVHEDDRCFAIVSQQPINRYHLLVIPRQHYVDSTDLPDDLAAHIFLVAKRLSVALRKVARPDSILHLSEDDISRLGYNLVAHYKFHLIPRYKDDGVTIDWNRQPDPGLDVRASVAKEIAAAISR
jgi:histidine triad (HIT) family protein